MRFLLLLPLLAQAQTVTLADYYKLETVSAPAISPDGKRIAYVTTRIIEADNRRQSEIRIVGAPFHTNGTNPIWSPDGKLLAYTNSGKHWALKADSLDAAPAPLPGAPVFSPDNQWIAFTRRTPPTARKTKPIQSDFERLTEQRFKGRIYDWMNFRFDGRGYLPDPRDPAATPPLELYVMPRAGGEAKQLTAIGVDVQGITWSPDSQSLAFTANLSQRDEHTYERADLHTVTLSGTVQRLTDDNHNASYPAWSPDGKSIAFLREQSLNLVLSTRQRFGSPTDICRIAANGGPLTNLTADWDNIPGKPQWDKTGKTIYFEAGIRGGGHLFALDVASKRTQQVTQGDRLLAGFDLNLDTGLIAYTATDSDSPVTLYSAPLAAPARESRLTTSSNQFTLGKTEHFSYDSKDGTPIDGWVTFPQNYSPQGGPYPLILETHGGPHGAYSTSFAFPHQLLAAQGYIVLVTNPRASTGYGEKFRWGTWGGWGDKDFEDVMSGVDYAIKHYRVDPARMGVTGYSYGGFLTNWIVGHTTRFRAAITGAGPTNWISNYGTGDIPRTKETEFLGPPWDPTGNATMTKYSPITYAANIKTPVLFIHGESDVRVPIAQAEELYTALQKQKIPTKFIRYPNSYHGNWAPWDTVHRYQQEILWWKQYLQ